MQNLIFRRRIFTVGVAIMSLALGDAAHADDSSAAWRKILSKCAKTDVIGSQSLFFGMSNTVGPGSVWRFADDKSLRLLFELSDAFPEPAEQAKMVVNNNIVSCSGNSSTGWDLSLGLPFSTNMLPLSIDLESLLKRSDKVSVSITGYAVDELKETLWKSKFKMLPPQNDYAQELVQSNRVIAENVVKVSGLKATFIFGNSLSADIKAKFMNKVISIGSAALHGEITGDNSITVTADGPFYMLAAYSKLVGSEPIGLDNVGSAPIVLMPAAIPPGTTPKIDRKVP